MGVVTPRQDAGDHAAQQGAAGMDVAMLQDVGKARGQGAQVGGAVFGRGREGGQLVEARTGVVGLLFEFGEAGEKRRGMAVILDSGQQVAGAGLMRFDGGSQGGAFLLNPSTGGAIGFGQCGLDGKQVVKAEGALDHGVGDGLVYMHGGDFAGWAVAASHGARAGVVTRALDAVAVHGGAALLAVEQAR